MKIFFRINQTEVDVVLYDDLWKQTKKDFDLERSIAFITLLTVQTTFVRFQNP